MKPTVDLSNLIEMIGDDPDIQKELFNEFIISFEKGCESLRDHTADSYKENWRSQAHALKGISYNLGAADLGDLCKIAQNNPETNEAEKTELLNKIDNEYAKVKLFLLSYTNA